MIVATDTVLLHSVNIAAAATPVPRQPSITPAAERESTDRRQTARDDRGHGADFRSVLAASTFDGLARALGGIPRAEWTPSKVARDAYAAPERMPAEGPVVLSQAEADSLFRRAKETSRPAAPAPEFLAATSRYAKSFFSVSGTFARPGESLKMTV